MGFFALERISQPTRYVATLEEDENAVAIEFKSKAKPNRIHSTLEDLRDWIKFEMRFLIL